MTCREFVELVTAYLDGTLDAPAEARFTEHLAECDGCDTYLAQFRQTIGALGHLPAESVTGLARVRLLTAFRDWHRS